MVERTLKLTLDKAKELYNNGDESIKELLLSTFSKEELEQKELPKTWEEWIKRNPKVGIGESYIASYSNIDEFKNTVARKFSDSNLLPSKEQAETILTLIKLIRIRDTYRQGWKPDWNNTEDKYCILYLKYGWTVTKYYETCVSIFSFQSEIIAQKFLDNFINDIDKLKCLL